MLLNALMLAAASALAGLALAFYYFRWPMLAVCGFILTIIAAILFHYNRLGAVAEFAIVFGCLSLNQIAYLIGTMIVSRGSEQSE